MRKSIDEKIAVMQAYADDDARLQARALPDGEWKHFDASLDWDWAHFDYRVEPEPEGPPPPRLTEFLIARRAYSHDDVYNLVTPGDTGKWWEKRGFEVFKVRAVDPEP